MHVSTPHGSRQGHELTDATTVFRTEQRFTDPATAAPESEPDWLASTPPIGIPMDPLTPAAPLFNQYVAEHPVPSYRPSVPQTPPYPDLSTGALLRQAKPAPPTSGWRRWLYLASGKLINVGEGQRAAHHTNLVAQVNRPLKGCYKIALLSLKGGVGKTTITATLGGTIASIRGDRVVAVDAIPTAER